MKKLKKFLFAAFTVAILSCLLCQPAFAAISESDVQAQVDAVGKEAVSGNVFIWFLCAIGFLKVGQKIDSFLSSLGVNVGHTGGSMLAEAMIAARGIGGIKNFSSHHFGGGRNSSSTNVNANGGKGSGGFGAGTFFGGMFKARNVIEAGILAFAIGVPVFSLLPLGLTARIIALCLTALPAALVALIGISGESLSSFLLIFIKYLRNRRIVGGNSAEDAVSAAEHGGKHIKKKAHKPDKAPRRSRRSGREDFPAEFDEVRSYEIRQKLRPVKKQKPAKEKKAAKQKKKVSKERKVKRPIRTQEPKPACLNPVADYLPISKIENGIIYTKDHRYVKVVEVVPINFMLRSAQEQRNIIYSFVSYLKISPIKLQIKVLTRRAEINRHLDTVRKEMEQETNRYPQNLWQEIIGNCDAQLFLGCTDQLTAEFISARTGLASVAVSSKSKQLGTWRISNYTPEFRETSGVGKRPVLTPDEVLRLPLDQALIIIRGKKVLQVDKMDYSKHPEAKYLRSCKASAHVPEWRRLEEEAAKTPQPAPKPAPAAKKPAKRKTTKPASPTDKSPKEAPAPKSAGTPEGIITTDKDSILS